MRQCYAGVYKLRLTNPRTAHGAFSGHSSDSHLQVVTQKNVPWLDVAVHDAVGVEVLEATGCTEQDAEAIWEGGVLV